MPYDAAIFDIGGDKIDTLGEETGDAHVLLSLGKCPAHKCRWGKGPQVFRVEFKMGAVPECQLQHSGTLVQFNLCMFVFLPLPPTALKIRSYKLSLLDNMPFHGLQ